MIKPIQQTSLQINNISSPISPTTTTKTNLNNNFSIRSNASTMTSNSSNSYMHNNNKKIGKILYGNCLSPITNSTDSLSIVKQQDNDESNNEMVKTNNKRNFFRKFKSKRTEIATSKTQTNVSNNSNSNNENFFSNKKNTEKIKLHLSRESLIDKDLKRVLLNNEEDLIDLDLDTELDLTISYCIPQTKTLPIISSSIITNEITRSHTVGNSNNNNKTQHLGSNSTLNDSQFSFNEVSTISSMTSSPQPTTITTCSPVNTTNENENDADIDDVSLSINDWQVNSKVNKSNNVNTGKINLNQLKTSNSKLKSKIYYDNLHSNFEYNDDIKITSGQITKYFSDKVKNDTGYSERSITALSNYDNIATEYQSNEFLSPVKITKLVPPTIITIPKSETQDSAIYSPKKLSLSDNNGLKSISVTPSSIIFSNSVTPSGSTSSSNSSSSSCVDSTNGNINNTQNNKNSNNSNNNNIHGCSCLVCNCKYNFSTDMSSSLTFNSLSIKQIILLKKYSLNKLNELLHRYVSPIDLSKIKLSSNYDKTSKFYSFRSFNTHTSTSSIVKEKRLINGNLNNTNGINSTTNSYNIHNNNNNANIKPMSNYRVFGLNLSTHYQRTGSPLPDIILNAINIIESNCKDLIGIFRKPGVKTRIDEIHKLIDMYPTFKFLLINGDDFNKENDSSTQITYSIGDEYQNFNNNKIDFFDVADLVKQFFKQLPECILTNNLSQVILSIYLSTDFPENERFTAMQYAVLLMPDENREALYTILKFLNSIDANKDHNSMNATNLATCFVPSIFNLNMLKITQAKENTILSSMFSPKRLRKQMGMILDNKDMEEQRTAVNCCVEMILKYKELFNVPLDLIERFNFNCEDAKEQIRDLQLILARNDDSYKFYVRKSFDELLRESKDRAKGWVSKYFEYGIEVFSKRVHDSFNGEEIENIPLKLFKCTMEIEAIPIDLCQQVIHDRNYWDKSVDEFEKLISLDNETDIVRYTLKSMKPHLNRELIDFQSWKVDLQKRKYALIATSLHSVNNFAPIKMKRFDKKHTIKADLYQGHFLIEQSGHHKLRIVHLSRIDLKGKSLKWYSNIYPNLLHKKMFELKSYLSNNINFLRFQHSASSSSNSFETKI